MDAALTFFMYGVGTVFFALAVLVLIGARALWKM